MPIPEPRSANIGGAIERNVEPVAQPLAALAAMAPWFGSLDDRLLTPTLPPPRNDGEYLAVLRPEGTEDAVAAITALGADARSYRCIPMVVFAGSERLAQEVAAIPGVEHVVVAAAGSRDTRSLVEGFDQLMAVEQLQRLSAPHAPDVVGGLEAADEGGYPTLAPGHDDVRYVIDADTERRLPTSPALMPVVNFSVGTKSLDYPAQPNDPVNVATWAASRLQLVVVAAGNSGAVAGRESMSAWAEMPWVLAVGGTADRAGLQLAEMSSRGTAGDPQSGPDLVAYGASELDETVTGTSFAAPRVSNCALLAAAAILQLRSAWLGVVGGGSVAGVQLVGSGFVDVGFESLRRFHLTVPALPIVGPVADIAEVFAEIEASGAHLSVMGSPNLVREMLLAAARPVPGCGPHEVGAGFIDDELLLDQVAGWTAADVVRAFGSKQSPAPPPLAAALAGRPVFDRDALSTLRDVVDVTMPLWAYDYRRAQLGRIA